MNCARTGNTRLQSGTTVCTTGARSEDALDAAGAIG
jgi:hypothetical protein